MSSPTSPSRGPGARGRFSRLPRPLRWLQPGLGVKRWLGLMLAALLVLCLGTACVIGVGGMAEVTAALGSPEAASFLGGVLAMLGVLGIMLALRRLLGSVAEPLRPTDERALVDVLLEHHRLRSGLPIVAIGGGTGLATLLRGLKHHTDNLVAIAAVSDDGGSSGQLQREMQVLPPGDIRNCLVALADDETMMSRLLQYRFADGLEGLNGHSLGNLVIAALTEITGNFDSAVRETSKVLAIRGRVVPATLEPVTLVATLDDGSTLVGETQIGRCHRHIEYVRLDPGDPEPVAEAIEAIRNAAVIIIGPGSTYTSVIPNLLVPGIAAAVAESQALKAFVCNVMTQPGETDDLLMVSDHVRALSRHTEQSLFQYVLVNDGAPHRGVLSRYEAEGARLVTPDTSEVARLGFTPVRGDFISRDDFARHDPDRLAEALLRLAAEEAQVV